MVFKFYSKPRDRSLKAFKEWFHGYHHSSLKSANNVITRYWIDEGQWIAHWKTFWTKVDGSSSQQGPRDG
jgi:hypothetical protein